MRAQIHERALAIIDRIEPVVEGYDSEGSPNWKGPSENFWRTIIAEQNSLATLIAICQADFPTFCAVFLRVIGKETLQIRPFIFNCAQHYLWNRHIVPLQMKALALWMVVLKSRQVGISTFVVAWQFWMLWRKSDTEVVMVGNTRKVVETFIDYFRMFHDELPNIPVIKPVTRAAKHGQGRIPKHEAYFDDRRCKATIMVDKQFSTRGLHAVSFQLSEAGHYENLENVLLTLKPLLPPLGSAAHKQSCIWVESTPRGQNYFYELYQQAKGGDSTYHSVFIPWMVSEDMFSVEPPKGWRMGKKMQTLQHALSVERRKHDGKDVSKAQMYWFEREKIDQGYNEDMMEQEYPSNDNDCFLLTTRSVFKDALKWLQQSCSISESIVSAEWAKRDVKIDYKQTYVSGELEYPPAPSPFADKHTVPKFMPKFRVLPGGRYTIWSPPQKGHVYAIGADPSGGTGNDNGILSVLDVSEGCQVAEFADSHAGPEDLADHAVALGYWFNTAVVLPEINVFSSCMKRMKQVWRYPKVGKEEKWDEPALKKGKFGYYMNPATKRQMVTEMRFIINNHHLRIASRALLAELSTFEENWEDRDLPEYGGAKGSHDDRVIALGLALMAVKQSPRLSRLLLARNHDRVPTAEELGLAVAPALVSDGRPNAHLDSDIAENPWNELEPALMRQLDSWGAPRMSDNQGFPNNPISGY